MSRTEVRNEAISGKDASTDVVVRRHRLSARTKFDLVFDTGLFVAFAIAYAEDFTGLSLHEWFGIAFGVALLFHFSLHWEWVVRTTKGMLTTSGRRRVMWLVNLALLGDLMLCIGSGILITGWRVFGVVFNSNTFWNNLHGTTAVVAIALIGIHIGLDWRWIANASRRMTRRSPRRVGGTSMRTETFQLLLRKRVRAFVGATTVVAVLWLLAVLVVNVFASSSPLGDGDRHLPKGVVRLPGGVLRVAERKGGVRLVLLHNPGGTPVDLMAWHTVVQCLILVTLAALVIAGLDRLRRKMRRSQRVRRI